jgi:hypothetical protein
MKASNPINMSLIVIKILPIIVTGTLSGFVHRRVGKKPGYAWLALNLATCQPDGVRQQNLRARHSKFPLYRYVAETGILLVSKMLMNLF